MPLFGPKNPQIASTQDILQFAQIRDNTAILRDGNLRQIILCSSINFALKSEQEQNAIIFQFQGFLNSLSFPIQILMQSKQLDLTNYLAKLEKIAAAQTNGLLKAQTTDYIDFIGKIIVRQNIMDKRFYVVIPYMLPVNLNTVKASSSKNAPKTTITPENFQKYKIELEQRVQVVQNGLETLGIRSATLNTQQIIELLYGVYNPEEASKEKIVEAEALSGQVVSSELLRPQQQEKS